MSAISAHDSIAYLEIGVVAAINLTSMHLIIYLEIASRYIDVNIDAKMTIWNARNHAIDAEQSDINLVSICWW